MASDLELYKMKAVFDAAKYRGAHITPQASQVIERVLGMHIIGPKEVRGMQYFCTSQLGFQC